MKFDAVLSPTGLKDVPATAKAAEEAGFDALWTQETQHDPFLPCALIAEHTARLHFGTAIAVSFRAFAGEPRLSRLGPRCQSEGRFILGLGTQVKAHVERRFGLSWPELGGSQLREQIQVIRAFWDCWQNGTKLNYRGEYYKITLMSPFFNPGAIKNPTIPIYIAGVNTGLAKLAGELCDGFHAHPFHSVKYLSEVLLPAIEEGAKKERRKRNDVSVLVNAFVATTPEEMDFARAQISFYASTPSYRPVMDLHGWSSVAEQLSAHAARGAWAEMPMLITDEMLHEFCLLTEEDKLADELRKRYDGIADRLTIYTPFVPGERDEWWTRLTRELTR